MVSPSLAHNQDIEGSIPSPSTSMNKCLHCGILVKNKYCSISCQNKHLGSARKKLRVVRSCVNCNTQFEVKEKETKRFCSCYCFHVFRSKLAKNDSDEKKLFARQAREVARNKSLAEKYAAIPFERRPKRIRIRDFYKLRGNVCEECGFSFTDDRGKGPFEIHHVDGNRENNLLENLKCLCLICHWKTGNYRFKNRTHSEETRKKLSELSKKQKRKKTIE